MNYSYLLILAVTGSLLAWYSINALRLPERLKLTFKPFNCTTCLSFWTTSALYFVPEFIVTFLFACILAAAIGVWLEK